MIRSSSLRTSMYLLGIFLSAEALVRANRAALNSLDSMNGQALIEKPALYARRAQQTDICLIGTSRLQMGCYGKRLAGSVIRGIPAGSVFNFGIELQGPASYWSLIQTQMKPDKFPKIAVLEASPCDFNGSFRDPGLLLQPVSLLFPSLKISGSPHWLFPWVVQKADEALESVWMLYRYRRVIEFIVYERLERLLSAHISLQIFKTARLYRSELNEFPCDINGDLVENEKRTPSIVRRVEEGGSDFFHKRCANFSKGTLYQRYFENSIKILLENGSQVVLIHMPMSEPAEAVSYPQNAWDSYAAFMTHLASKHRIPFINFTRQQCGLGIADYVDPAHLNSAGAEKFTSCLRRELEKL